MSAEVRTFEDYVMVDDGQFYLLDEALLDMPIPDFSPEEWVKSGRDWIAFLSGGQDHDALVRFEVWSGRPRPNADLWEANTEIEFQATSGKVRLWAPTIGPSESEILLGHPGRYRVRVYSRGRQAVAEAIDAITSEDAELPRGIEQYLLQFWPTKDG